MRLQHIRPVFVEYIPDKLESGVLYISERFRTCSHLCCCGCGEEVVTPLSRAEWQLSREGGFVSLWPSIGNWDYRCRSHYVIRRNKVKWAGAMSARQVALVKQRDRADLISMIAATSDSAAQGNLSARARDDAIRSPEGRPSLIRRVLNFFFG
jgi:hypothetical protein